LKTSTPSSSTTSWARRSQPDTWWRAATKAIRQEQKKIPRDISLVGFDDARWAQYCDPPLTVVAQPTDAMGRKAAELVLGRLRGEIEAKVAVFEPELVIRRSTARPNT